MRFVTLRNNEKTSYEIIKNHENCYTSRRNCLGLTNILQWQIFYPTTSVFWSYHGKFLWILLSKAESTIHLLGLNCSVIWRLAHEWNQHLVFQHLDMRFILCFPSSRRFWPFLFSADVRVSLQHFSEQESPLNILLAFSLFQPEPSSDIYSPKPHCFWEPTSIAFFIQLEEMVFPALAS